jgi:hypothetical protein
MDIVRYRHRPTEVSTVAFAGTLVSAQEISNWVEAGSGLKATLAPTAEGNYRVYIPTPSGTFTLEPGMVLVQVSPTEFYPITAGALIGNYERMDSSDEGTQKAD